MKRSDMIRIIDDFIYQRTSVTGVESLKLAKILIDEIEEAGMLPPCDYVNNGGSSSTCGHQLCAKWKED